MKYFTVKDFMLYNGPCFNCGKKVQLSAHQLNFENNKYSKIPLYVAGDIISIPIPPIELKIDVSSNLYKTIWTGNNILGYDPNYLSFYLQNKSLNFISSCRNCLTKIVSNDLVFDNKNIKPISIAYEKLIINTDECTYIIESKVSNNYGKLRIFDEKGRKEKESISIPPLLLGKLKTKTNTLKKIHTYILYS